jgi:hypothetical protein
MHMCAHHMHLNPWKYQSDNDANDHYDGHDSDDDNNSHDYNNNNITIESIQINQINLIFPYRSFPSQSKTG